MSKISSIIFAVIIIFVLIWLGIIAIKNTQEQCIESIDDEGEVTYNCSHDTLSITIDKNEVKENAGNLRKVWSNNILRNRT